MGSRRECASGVVIEGINESYTAIGSHSSGESISSAKSFAKPDGANAIIAQAIAQNARFRIDGGTPTTAIGFRITAGNDPILIAVPGASISFIEEAATCTLQYQWVAQ